MKNLKLPQKMDKWNKCDICGRFIAYDDFTNGKAINNLLLPDSDLTIETWETVHKTCLLKEIENTIEKLKESP